MNLLSIGGSDPSSGAGIQGDIKTFSSLNVYGLTVVTAITSQNTSNFGFVEPISSKMIKSQLDSIFSDFTISGIKIGMVYNSEIIQSIHSKLKNKDIPIVIDPVIQSTTGGMLIEKRAISDFKKFLIPLATVITPNRFEAQRLSRIRINSKKSLHESAKIIQNMGAKNIIVTGLEFKNNQIFDFILEKDSSFLIQGKKIEGVNHGSGCNYSAALLFAITKKQTIKEAAKFSQNFTFNSIRDAKIIGNGIPITQLKNKDHISKELIEAIKQFIEIKNIYKKIPECQTNFVFSKRNPRSIKEVLGISGRIVKTGNTVSVAGDLAYGGSVHVATALITLNKKFPEICSALNLKYNVETISKLKKNGLIVANYDRKIEPKFVKNKEGSSISWGIKQAIKNLDVSPDVVYHTGDFGKEPMIIVFAKSPSLLVEKILQMS